MSVDVQQTSAAAGGPESLPARRGGRWRQKATPYGLVAPGMILLVVLFLIPTVYNVWLSFVRMTPYDSLGEGTWVGLRNYVDVLGSELTRTAAFNTVFWLTLVTVIGRLVFGLGIALLLNADVLRRLHLTGIARTAILIPWMIPPTVAIAAWKWLLDGQSGIINIALIKLGLIDQGIPFLADTATVWPAIVTIMTWRELPFVVIVITAGLAGISQDQYEAASLDGAGWWRSTRHITLPNLTPVIGVVTLMITIGSFNNFLYVWLTTGGGPGTYTQVLATQLYSYAFVDNDLGRGAAIGMLMTVCMAVFAAIYFILLQRRERT